jgi:hypothetical protein
MKRALIISGLVLILVVTVLLLFRRASGTPDASLSEDATVLLIGFTNISSKGKHAMFCFTNNTTTHIAFVPDSLEQKVEGAWVRTPLTGRAGRVVRNWIGLREELSPEGAFNFYVPTTNGGTWRLVFMCHERARVRDSVSDVYRHVTDTNAAAVQSRVFSGRRYSLTTPEVNE